MTANYPLELDMLLLIIVLLPCFITLDEAGTSTLVFITLQNILTIHNNV